MPTAAPPSGNPANALISVSKDARGAPSGLSTLNSERPDETTKPRDVSARQSGSGVSRTVAAESRRSLGRKAPSIGGTVIEASPRPNQLSIALRNGFMRGLPNTRRARSIPDRRLKA
jgi:hypothetical protein